MRENYSDATVITLTGTVVEIIFTNEENGYTVCEIQNREDGLFTVTGYLPYISEGENIEMTGKWITHPEYGEQFSAITYKTVLPTDENAILLYLSSGIIPGIREATAKKIVDAFGDDAFNVLLNFPERLSEIKGITKSKALGFSEEFQRLQSVSGIVMFLQQFGISAKLATAVHKILGADAVEKIKENPYILADRVDGITFKTSDNIAHILGLPKNSIERIKAFVKYTLMLAAYQSGHTYLPKNILIENITSRLEVTEDVADNALTSLVMDKDVFMDTVMGDEVCYLMTLLTAELYVARRLCSLADADQKYTMAVDIAQKMIDEISKEDGFVLDECQRQAALSSVTDGCVVITGGPGTGKTTTLNTIIRLMQKMSLKIALAAPTGRAAKRISEITGLEAKTVHRLLGVVRNDSELYLTFSKNDENPLSSDVIIVDEVSMLDINLMSSLLKAVKPGAKVILVGDADQLPSVGPGNVLRDIINSGAVNVIKLEHIFRQAQESLIVVNAHKINNGEMPVFESENPNFFFMRRNDSTIVNATIADLYKNRLPASYGINPINSVQVLSPSRKGTAGVNSLNEILQNEINPPDYMKAQTNYGKTVFRVGDKVMQTKHNYDIEWVRDNGEEGCGIFNGDIGIIQKISSIDKVLEIVFDDDKRVMYNFSDLEELELAYAITVHKSQGNEFDYVIISVSSFNSMLMFKNLLYTAVTRAKKMVILVGSEASIVRMIKNTVKSQRYSGLCERMRAIKEMLKDEFVI